MFEEKLIQEVVRNKCLWDKNSPTYRSKLLIQQAWIHISHTLGESEDYCRHRWKSLRDRFVLECKLIKKNPSGSRKKWTHFDQLMFLRNCVTGKAGLLSLPKGKESTLDVDEFCETQDGNKSEPLDTHSRVSSEYQDINSFDGFSFVNTGENINKEFYNNEEQDELEKKQNENSQVDIEDNIRETSAKAQVRRRPQKTAKFENGFDNLVENLKNNVIIEKNTKDPFLAAIGEIFELVPERKIKFKLDILNYAYKKYEELEKPYKE